MEYLYYEMQKNKKKNWHKSIRFKGKITRLNKTKTHKIVIKIGIYVFFLFINSHLILQIMSKHIFLCVFFCHSSFFSSRNFYINEPIFFVCCAFKCILNGRENERKKRRKYSFGISISFCCFTVKRNSFVNFIYLYFFICLVNMFLFPHFCTCFFFFFYAFAKFTIFSKQKTFRITKRKKKETSK